MEEDEKNKENEYHFLKNSIDSDYVIKSNEAKNILESHWKSFDEQKKKLESIVGEDFKKVVKKFESNDGIKIKEFSVEYKPEFQSLGINVLKLEVLNKHFPFEAIFAGYFDNRLDPEVKQFRDLYHVNYIGYSPK